MHSPSLIRDKQILLLMASVLFIGMSVRGPFMVAAPLLKQITEDTGLPAGAGGLLTTIPVFCFAVFSPFAPRLAARLGIARLLAFAFLAALSGVALRLFEPLPALFGGTIVIGFGLALGNALLPAFIKQWAGGRVAALTALSSTGMLMSTAVSTGLTVPIMEAGDLTWRQALMWPAIFLIAAVGTLSYWAHREGPRRAAATVIPIVTPLWRNRLALAVTGYMGVQSLIAYSSTSWLPAYLMEDDMSAANAGYTVMFSRVFGALGSVVVSAMLAKRVPQRTLMLTASCAIALGVIGVVTLDSWAVIGAFVMGFGGGQTLSLGLTFINTRTYSLFASAQLSSMAQTLGNVIAATGPIGLGVIADLTGGYTVSILVLLIATIPLTLFGLVASGNRYVDTTPAEIAGVR